jgi:hypothetical protein
MGIPKPWLPPEGDVMVTLLAFVGCILLAVAMRLGVPSLRRRRMAAELRGDWWSRFERELRAYERTWRPAQRQRPH